MVARALAAAAVPQAVRGPTVLDVRDVAVAGCLARVSLAVRAGERVVLLGRNGIGKTTLLRLIAGLGAPDGGAIHRAGAVGYLPQSYRAALLPWLRVRTNIALATGTEGPHAEARVTTALTAAGLRPELLDRFPYQLSGGEQQLVGLARALAGRPALLLFDEPFSALDAPTRLHLRSVLREGLGDVAVLMVSHDLDDAVALADRALVLGGSPATVRAEVAIDARRRDAARAELSRLLEDVA